MSYIFPCKQLSTLEAETINDLPSLTILNIYDNTTDFAWKQSPCCVKPVQPLFRVPLERLTGQCSPRILPLYAPNHQVLLSDQIQLNCRAVGQPKPRISWLLPPRESGCGEQGLRMVKSSTHLGSDDRIRICNRYD